jgi:subtilisin family serine protease
MGSSFWSTVPGINGYASKSGTLMATPHVTCAAALYKALYPQATAAQIKAVILNGATAMSSLNGKVVTGGWLNVTEFSTLLTSPTPTTQPTPMVSILFIIIIVYLCFPSLTPIMLLHKSLHLTPSSLQDRN